MAKADDVGHSSLELYIGILEFLSRNGPKSQQEIRQQISPGISPRSLSFLGNAELIRETYDSNYVITVPGVSVLRFFKNCSLP
jgi:hypothetical protein